jgi:hypothetical protein
VDRVVVLGKHLVEEIQSGKFMCFYLFVWCYMFFASCCIMSLA